MRRWQKVLLITLAVVAFVLFVLPFLIPLPPDGVQASTFADTDGRFIDVNGLQTYVRERGTPGEPVVLLMHGWGGSTFSWREQIDVLDEAGYRVIAFDRPPYGLSQKTGDLPLTQTQQADFTIAVMDALDLPSAVLVGHSMGGGVIGYVAARYPDRVERLVFVDGAPRIEDAQSAAETSAPRNPRLNSTLGVPQGATGLLSFPPFERWARILARLFVQPGLFTELQKSAYYDPAVVTPEVAAGYQRQLEIVGWDEALLAILSGRSFGDAPLTQAEAAAIIMPTLILWGAEDTWVPLSAGERLASALPNAQIITYPLTGHLPMEEQPETFNRDLLTFLEGAAS